MFADSICFIWRCALLGSLKSVTVQGLGNAPWLLQHLLITNDNQNTCRIHYLLKALYTHLLTNLPLIPNPFLITYLIHSHNLLTHA